MAYVGDWFSTPPDERKRLQETCTKPGCFHPRYLHGETAEQRQNVWRWIEHTPGKCIRCKCDAFADENAITKDEVLDVHEQLERAWRVADIGITPLTCDRPITRFYDQGTIELKCIRANGHEGAHEGKE